MTGKRKENMLESDEEIKVRKCIITES